MSLQQLEAFLSWAEAEPGVQAPLALAPDAAAVAAIARAAGFDVSGDDLLLATGEPAEVLRMVEIVSLAVEPPPGELAAFLQQVEGDADLQRVLASAPDAEGVAAVARIAGYQVSAADIWEASDETPEALLEPDLVLELWTEVGAGAAAPPAATADGQDWGDRGAATAREQGAAADPDGSRDWPSAEASSSAGADTESTAGAPHQAREAAAPAPMPVTPPPSTASQGPSRKLDDPWRNPDPAA
jgi:predicted ribosomally synthesized peptide with nif11-like leader